MIIDSHCHLDAFDSEELQVVLDEARAADVGLIVTVGMDVETSARGVEIAESEETVFAAVGLHPWLVQDYPDGVPIDELRDLAQRAKVVAIGEIGLDFIDNKWTGLSYEDPALQRLQEEAFRQQVRLAKSLELPVIIHSRRAHAAVARILDEEGMATVGGCVQFQDGSIDDVRRYRELGFFLSVGSSVTFPDTGAWHETVRSVATDELVLESDAPWLPFDGHPSGRSRPSDLILIGEAIARVRDEDPAGMYASTAENLLRALPKIGSPP
jgi:TatD DNase family protein